MTCPCGSKNVFLECCGKFIQDLAFPTTPEELMRSRYTAYTLGDIRYIKKTMTGPALITFDTDATQAWIGKITWIHLKIIKTNSLKDKGFVEFVATFLENNKKNKIHETSLFQKIEGKWYYIQGKHYK